MMAEAALSGSFSPDAVDGLSVSADGMIADMHGSAAYRANLVKVLTKRAVAACCPASLDSLEGRYGVKRGASRARQERYGIH